MFTFNQHLRRYGLLPPPYATPSHRTDPLQIVSWRGGSYADSTCFEPATESARFSSRDTKFFAFGKFKIILVSHVGQSKLLLSSVMITGTTVAMISYQDGRGYVSTMK